MADQVVSADICSKMVESATRACQPVISVPAEQGSGNLDAVAVALTAQSNAIAFGAVVLAIIVAIAGIAWGKIITMNAEQEAREKAEQEVKNWLQDEGFPLVFREVSEFLRTFSKEAPISEEDIAAMVAAAGLDGKEGDNGEK